MIELQCMHHQCAQYTAASLAQKIEYSHHLKGLEKQTLQRLRKIDSRLCVQPGRVSNVQCTVGDPLLVSCLFYDYNHVLFVCSTKYMQARSGIVIQRLTPCRDGANMPYMVQISGMLQLHVYINCLQNTRSCFNLDAVDWSITANLELQLHPTLLPVHVHVQVHVHEAR